MGLVRWLQGQAGYLIHHRGVTHSILGVLVQAPLLAGLMWAIGRRFAVVRYRWLLLAALVGLASHPLLDGLNTYGIRPWLPFDGTWVYGDAANIVEPWLWVLFGAAACFGAPRMRAGWPAFGMLAIVAAVTTHRISGGVAAAFALGIAAVAAMRAFGAGRRASRVALGAAVAYIGALFVASHVAVERARAELGAAEAYSAHPTPGVPWRVRVLAQRADEFVRVRVDLFGGVDGRERMARRIEPVESGSLEVRAWKVFARHPFVARDGGRVILGDARYGFVARPSWCNLEVP